MAQAQQITIVAELEVLTLDKQNHQFATGVATLNGVEQRFTCGLYYVGSNKDAFKIHWADECIESKLGIITIDVSNIKREFYVRSMAAKKALQADIAVRMSERAAQEGYDERLAATLNRLRELFGADVEQRTNKIWAQGRADPRTTVKYCVVRKHTTVTFDAFLTDDDSICVDNLHITWPHNCEKGCEALVTFLASLND